MLGTLSKEIGVSSGGYEKLLVSYHYYLPHSAVKYIDFIVLAAA
jgi:hypothetical protein